MISHPHKDTLAMAINETVELRLLGALYRGTTVLIDKRSFLDYFYRTRNFSHISRIILASVKIEGIKLNALSD